MSQAQLFHRSRSSNSLDQTQYDFACHQFSLAYHPNQVSTIRQSQAMAQSSCVSDIRRSLKLQSDLPKRYPHKPGMNMPPQYWPSEQGFCSDFKSRVNQSTGNNTGHSTAMHNSIWEGVAANRNSSTWPQAMQLEPYVLSDTEAQYYQNNNPTFEFDAAQNLRNNKPLDDIYVRPSWAQQQEHLMLKDLRTDNSDIGTISSHSPHSYSSDTIDDPFSPGPLISQRPAENEWHIAASASRFPEVAVPTSISLHNPYDMPSIPEVRYTASSTGSSPSTIGLGVVAPRPLTALDRRALMPASPLHSSISTVSEDSILQEGRIGSSSQYPACHMFQYTRFPYTPQGHDAVRDSQSSQYSVFSASHTACPPAPWSSRPGGGTQDRFKTPRTAHTEAQRQHNDHVLVQGKKEGLTYKEIRSKMIGERPAESTLRGRYRSLTKARKDRVRRPTWTKLDVS